MGWTSWRLGLIMAFDIDPIEFLKASRRANAENQSKIKKMDFGKFGDPSLFATSRRKSRDIDSSAGFEDLSSSGLINEDNTNALLGIKADEVANAASNIGLMAELDVKKYGAEKMAEEQKRREALMRAQCQKKKRGGVFGSIGSIVGGIVTGNYGAAIAGGANLIGGSGGC